MKGITGENFKRVSNNTETKKLKNEILKLQEQCAKLYRECRDTGNFNSVKHDKLSKEIEWLEYLLWGERKGILR